MHAPCRLRAQHFAFLLAEELLVFLGILRRRGNFLGGQHSQQDAVAGVAGGVEHHLPAFGPGDAPAPRVKEAHAEFLIVVEQERVVGIRDQLQVVCHLIG